MAMATIINNRVPTLIDAIRSLVGNGTGFYTNNVEITEWDTLEVKSNVAQPTQSAIDTELARLIEVYNAQDYARSRELEYPSLQECVHAILDDDLVALQVLRQEVKD